MCAPSGEKEALLHVAGRYFDASSEVHLRSCSFILK